MYESYYGFKEKPFSLRPDPDFLYLGREHSAALAMLQYGVMDEAGFTVITGEIGCGKTTLIRRVLAEVESIATVGLITNTHESFGDLLQWILLAFGLEYQNKSKPERYETFVQFLVDEYANGKRVVLVIDEAQNLPSDRLEECRMLSNVNADKHQILQLVLVGQPQLRDMLTSPALRQFAQRVVADYHVKPLRREEVGQYIVHRLHVASGDKALFSPETFDVIYEYTRGIPRLINVICHTALVYGFSAQLRKIEAELVHEVATDRKHSQMFTFPGTVTKSSSPLNHPTQDVATMGESVLDNDTELDELKSWLENRALLQS